MCKQTKSKIQSMQTYIVSKAINQVQPTLNTNDKVRTTINHHRHSTLSLHQPKTQNINNPNQNLVILNNNQINTKPNTKYTKSKQPKQLSPTKSETNQTT